MAKVEFFLLDFIGNASVGFLDQSDAAHPAGFPIMTDMAVYSRGRARHG